MAPPSPVLTIPPVYIPSLRAPYYMHLTQYLTIYDMCCPQVSKTSPLLAIICGYGMMLRYKAHGFMGG